MAHPTSHGRNARKGARSVDSVRVHSSLTRHSKEATHQTPPLNSSTFHPAVSLFREDPSFEILIDPECELVSNFSEGFGNSLQMKFFSLHQKCLSNSSGRLVTSQKELTVPSKGNFSSMPSLRQFPFLIPKRVVFKVGNRNWHIRITWGDFFFFQTTVVCPATFSAPFRFCYTLGTGDVFENTSCLIAWSSHLHHDFANLCAKILSFCFRSRQLPPGRERCQLGPQSFLGNGRRPELLLFPELMMHH